MKDRKAQTEQTEKIDIGYVLNYSNIAHALKTEKPRATGRFFLRNESALHLATLL